MCTYSRVRRRWLSLIFLVIAFFHGAQVQSALSDADNALFKAVREDDSEAITAAIKTDGADIDAIGTGGQTPLMNAVLTGKVNAVETLLKLGADVTIGEKDGYTPMHGAGFQGRARIAQILIDHGLNPSDRHKDGYTPLHRACWGREDRHTKTVKVLLENGVSVYEQTGDGKSPIQIVKNPKTKLILEKFIKIRMSDEF